MRVDIETHTVELEAMSRFQLARLRSKQLFYANVTFSICAAALFFVWLIIDVLSPHSVVIPVLLNTSAVLFTLLGVFQAALSISRWREHALEQITHFDDAIENEQVEESDEQKSSWRQIIIKQLNVTWLKKVGTLIPIDAIWVILLSVCALILVDNAWNLTLPAANASSSVYLLAGFLLLMAFSLLVLERYLVANQIEWPEAIYLAMILRVAITTLLLAVLALCYATAERVWPIRLAALIGLLPGIVSAELIGRALLSAFTPQRTTLEPKLYAISFAAELLRWPPKPMQLVQDGLFERFGIDLRQVWAFGFIKRAFLPIVALLCLGGWLLSGVHEVPMNGRAIYEKFGKPVTVFKSGLHTTLPWPFGRVINVEYGVVHELAASSDDNTMAPLTSAEGPAPETANRLWDATHRSEKSQIIASSNDGKQNFQIVDMDVRFIYRIGLNDQAALDATYNTADLPTLIRRTASRILVHDFAGRTLDDLLSEQRNQLSKDVGDAVQKDLDQLHSGVELLATAIEAIHPPAKAANAYHKVQSSQIEVQALIAREKGKAAAMLNQAQQEASLIADKAIAKAHQNLSTAQADKVIFEADKSAYQVAGNTFLRETYYQQLLKGMGQANSLIIDNRIKGEKSPTLDFRSFVPPVDPTQNAKRIH